VSSHTGSRRVAPFAPDREHRAQRLKRSLEAAKPQRIISGTNAIGAECEQPLASQWTHTQDEPRRSSVVVGISGGGARGRRAGGSSREGMPAASIRYCFAASNRQCSSRVFSKALICCRGFGVTSMSRKLKVRIETTGISDEEVARLVRDVARRIDDGRQRGIIERDGRQVGAWSFEDDIIVVKAGGESR
jgi:hypothetical protein